MLLGRISVHQYGVRCVSSSRGRGVESEFCCVLGSNFFFDSFHISSPALSTHNHKLSQASGSRESLLSVPQAQAGWLTHPLSPWSPSALCLQEKPHGPLILLILIPTCVMLCPTKVCQRDTSLYKPKDMGSIPRTDVFKNGYDVAYL